MSQNKDPNWVATFSMQRNLDKFDANNNVIAGKEKLPDLVSVNSEKVNQKTGKPYRKNFTINGMWHEPSGYVQKDGTYKITIKKSRNVSSTPKSDDPLNFNYGANV